MKWTKEACKKAVEDCTTKTELKKKWPGAYMAIKTNGWHELFDKLVDRRKIVSKEVAQKRAKNKTKWTKPECMKAALKCKTMREFRADYPKEYRASYKHGWLEEFTWLEKNVPEKNVCIYAYIFSELKTVYVGLTNNTKRRDKDHRRDFKYSRKDKTSAVYKFCQKNNLNVPNMTILKSNLPADTDGRYWEDYYVKKFKIEGWTLLNIAPTGANASIGSNATTLTKEECYRLSLDCTSRYEFERKHHREYQKSWREGWLDEFEHLIPKHTKWTNDLIWNEVYKHNSCAEFHKLSRNAYNAAWSRNMLSEIKAYYDKRA